MLALKFYSQALRQLAGKPDLAFISLVSAVEAVAGSHYDEVDVGFDDNLDQLLSQISDSRVQQKVRRTLWSRGAIKRKFLAFVRDYTPPSFWTDPSRPSLDIFRVNESDFPELLKRVYDARSGFLHSGTPLPPVVFQTVGGGEIRISASMHSGERMWLRSDYIPHISFIERLVGDVLAEFLDRNKEKVGTS